MGWNQTGNLLYAPLSLRNANTQNLVAYTGDAAFMPASPGLSAGYLYVCQAYVDQSVVANNAYICQLTAGSGCTNSFLGVYDPITGNRLAQTADISSQLNATQTTPIQAALTFALAPQPLDKALWLVVLIGSQTSTPTVVGRNNTGSNIGTNNRFMMSTTNGYSALPLTLPAISQAGPTQSQPFLAIGP